MPILTKKLLIPLLLVLLAAALLWIGPLAVRHHTIASLRTLDKLLSPAARGFANRSNDPEVIRALLFRTEYASALGIDQEVRGLWKAQDACAARYLMARIDELLAQRATLTPAQRRSTRLEVRLLRLFQGLDAFLASRHPHLRFDALFAGTEEQIRAVVAEYQRVKKALALEDHGDGVSSKPKRDRSDQKLQ